VPTPSAQAPRGFGNVETWVFDLDNTLYPHHLNLWQQVDDRIRAYVANFLKVSKDEAFRLQKDYYKRYGTTMRGMMTNHGMSPDDYLDFVHRIDHSPLTPNPALGAALEQLPGRKLILTNGTRKHADAVMQKLDIHHHFEDVFDIAAANLVPRAPWCRPGESSDVRGSGAQSGNAARAGHDHRAGGAGRSARSVSRSVGA
jgi:putative hydrolase of the HAD superfamily